MSEPSLQQENNSSVGSPADAGDATAGRHKHAALLDRFREHTLTTPFKVAGFWAAVALPFLYLPLLLTGISTDAELITFLGLVALNVAALLAGHGHNQD